MGKVQKVQTNEKKFKIARNDWKHCKQHKNAKTCKMIKIWNKGGGVESCTKIQKILDILNTEKANKNLKKKYKKKHNT